MAMACPQCNHPLRQPDDGSGMTFCSNCGWYRREATGGAAANGGRAGLAVGDMIKLLLGWLFSLALVLGPYVALWIYMPDAPLWIHLTYGLAMFVYLAAAATTTPDYDSSNLGWCGGLIDNPFSWEDDANRMGLFLAIFLAPGKITAWTLTATWHALRGG